MTTPLLSIVILSHNRRDALQRTLGYMTSISGEKHALTTPDLSISSSESPGWAVQASSEFATEVIVVDNASTDGSPEAVRSQCPNVHVVTLPSNEAIQGFNIGVARSRGEYLLILDDDAWVEPRVLQSAVQHLEDHMDVGGVALLPKHPKTRVSEWPFATRGSDDFPVMGCGNLVRAGAWRQVGGYEPGFFLYRNDVDLALKLLSAGWRVSFRPEWIVWHDSPAATKKSERWLHLATRNWVWLVRRHERNPVVVLAALLLHLATALRAAGLDVDRMQCVMAGFAAGLSESPPLVPSVCNRSGGLRALLRLRLGL